MIERGMWHVLVAAIIVAMLSGCQRILSGKGRGAERTNDVADIVYLVNWEPITVTNLVATRSGELYGIRKNHNEETVCVNGEYYWNAIAMHPAAQGMGWIDYRLNGAYRRFYTKLALSGTTSGTVRFSVYGDGTRLYRSPVVTARCAPLSVTVDIAGVDVLRLAVDGLRDNQGDAAVWCDPCVEEWLTDSQTGIQERVFSAPDVDDCQQISDWLAMWSHERPLARVSEFASLLTNVLADHARREALYEDTLAQADEFPTLHLLAKAVRSAADSNLLKRTLADIRDHVTAYEWPVYMYAIEHLAPPNWQSDLVVPIERLRGAGWLPERTSIATALWFGEYYRTYAGDAAERDYWEHLRRTAPQLAWSAAIVVARIEVYRLGIVSNAAPLLRNYLGEITNFPAQALEACQILTSAGTPDALELERAMRGK